MQAQTREKAPDALDRDEEDGETSIGGLGRAFSNILNQSSDIDDEEKKYVLAKMKGLPRALEDGDAEEVNNIINKIDKLNHSGELDELIALLKKRKRTVLGDEEEGLPPQSFEVPKEAAPVKASKGLGSFIKKRSSL